MPSATITITIDSKGRIRQVRSGRKLLRAKTSPPGANVASRVGRGDTVGLLELLKGKHDADAKRGKGRGKDKDKDKDKDDTGNGGGTDPCCIRDPRTGRVYCWC
jgi:hypothetical protein